MGRVLVLTIVFVCIRRYDALFSDEENAQLPRLFHLGDQDRCLLQEGGIYCLGEFDLEPIGASPMFENIKKYSSDEAAFNRSRLYRGYCVSEKCPQEYKTNTHITNMHATQPHALRFEKCVQKRVRPHALTARLSTLKYCTTHEEHLRKMKESPDEAQQLFLKVVFAILLLNITGTLYDIYSSSDKKNSLLTAWSIRSSWRRLTAVYDDGDPRLKQLQPVQGLRVFIMLMSIYCHTWVQQFQFFVTSPQNLEILFKRYDGLILSNGMSTIQGFIIMSSFLTAYNMLIYAEKRQLRYWMMPVFVLKRIIRIAPVHLILVGFAATYWRAMRSGASSEVIGELGARCRRKFWTHVFFMNNVIDKEDMCLPTTWFLPVDMHLFILSSALTIYLSRRRHLALRLYAALFVLSSAFCGVVAYFMDYRIAAATAVSETVRGLFLTTPSFSGYYTSTWGSLPACFVGLFFAHLHYDLQQRKYDWNKNLWLKRIYPWLIPALFLYSFAMGATLVPYKQRWVTALCVAVDRPVFICLMLGVLAGTIHYDGVMRDFFGWRGWNVLSRLSLPVMMCHWLISMVIAGRPVTYYTSVFDVSIDFLGTLFYGYAMSLPVSLLVEIPVQRFFAQLF